MPKEGFFWDHDLNGSKVPIIYPFYIASATAIELGEVVKYTPGTGIEAGDHSDSDTPHIGVSVESHDGSTTGRQSGTEIKISCSPTAVYRHYNANVITATGGSTTTFVVSGLLPQTDDLWIGGYIQVLTCAADSTLVGKKIKITDSTGSSGTLTFSAQSAAFASGDTAYLCPGPRALTEYGWDLDSDGMNIDWDTDSGESLVLVGEDAANMISKWMLRLHQFGNHCAAIT
jgi:hypothetical protein